jgi:hypothetical protein
MPLAVKYIHVDPQVEQCLRTCFLVVMCLGLWIKQIRLSICLPVRIKHLLVFFFPWPLVRE